MSKLTFKILVSQATINHPEYDETVNNLQAALDLAAERPASESIKIQIESQQQPLKKRPLKRKYWLK